MKSLYSTICAKQWHAIRLLCCSPYLLFKKKKKSILFWPVKKRRDLEASFVNLLLLLLRIKSLIGPLWKEKCQKQIATSESLNPHSAGENIHLILADKADVTIYIWIKSMNHTRKIKMVLSQWSQLYSYLFIFFHQGQSMSGGETPYQWQKKIWKNGASC